MLELEGKRMKEQRISMKFKESYGKSRKKLKENSRNDRTKKHMLLKNSFSRLFVFIRQIS